VPRTKTWDSSTRNCEVCSKPFEPNKPAQRCCSRSCAVRVAVTAHVDGAKWKSTTKTCEHCGDGYVASTRYSIETQRFCSASCASQHSWDEGTHPRSVEKIEKRCRVCDAVIVLNPSLREVRFTCSLECRGKWQAESGLWSGKNNGAWKGGTSAFWKAKARERDDYTCQVDGCDVRHEGKGTHAHHKLPVVAGGSDDLDNLITLCSEHHRVLEHQLFVMLLERCPKEAAILVQELYASG
jgi:HNH endonuclease